MKIQSMMIMLWHLLTVLVPTMAIVVVAEAEEKHHDNFSMSLLWKQVTHLGSEFAEFIIPSRQMELSMEFLLKHFDKDGDGHISASELLEMHSYQEPWSIWFRREWPLMDWKLGLFLWRSFSGLLLVLVVLSIVPGRLHGVLAKILRWPVLAMVGFLIYVELTVYIVIRLVIRIAEHVIARPKHRKLRRMLMEASSYEDWYKLARQLDQSQKRDRWLKIDDAHTSERYNWAFIRELLKEMRTARQTNNTLLALAVLQQCTRKNVGGVMSDDLFSYSNSGEPKYIVKEFVNEVVECVHWLTFEVEKLAPSDPTGLERKQIYDEIVQQAVREEKNKVWSNVISATLDVIDPNHKRIIQSPARPSLAAFHRLDVLDFLKRARAAYGRTALCLSGGAMMGLYHFGHVKALMEAGVLPYIISGTSGGSVIGAMVCTRTDEEIKRDFDPTLLISKLTCFDRPWGERLKSVWNNGCLFSFEDWMEKIQWFTCGQLTFKEAYEKTGRIFCVTLSCTTKKAPPVLLNYTTAPNVTVASAVIASAAVPGFVPPVRLQYKDANGAVRSQEGETYFDGSIEQDIPVAGLAEMFNCQFFIACQCNPHVVPFFYNPKGGVGRPSRWSSGTQEDSWRGGFLLAALEMYLKTDMKAKFRFLHELEALVGFTSSMFAQDFVGTTTIVPQVSFVDYFRLFSDPKIDELYRYYQAGSVAAYEHIVLIKLHYSLADAMEECIARLEGSNENDRKSRLRPRSKLVIPIHNQHNTNQPDLLVRNPSDKQGISHFFPSSGQMDMEDEDDGDELKWIKLE